MQAHGQRPFRYISIWDKRKNMRDNYDFSAGIKNPYAKKLKSQITIKIDNDTIAYFKENAAETGILYQNLINLYLRDCVENNKKPSLTWY